MEIIQGLVQCLQEPVEDVLEYAHSKMQFDRLEKENKMGTFLTFNRRLGKLQKNMLWKAIFASSFGRNYIR